MANKVLPPSEKLRIGSDLDCDLVLFDDSESSQQMELVAGRKGVMACLISGEAVCDNQPMDIGERYSVAVETPVRLGNSTFVVFESNAVSENEPDVEVAELNQNSPLSGESRGRAFNAIAVIVIGLTLVAGGLLSSVFKGDDKTQVAQLDFSAELEELGLPWIEQHYSDDDVPELTGYVANPGDMRHLEEIFQRHQVDVKMDVVVVSELHDAVASLYRINGLEAEIVSEGPGSVKVKTRTDDLELLARVEEGIRNDVPKLSSLTRDNTLPELETQVSKDSTGNYREDPEKRVMMVVAGNPSYVVTRDSARYFVGSLLPSGHKISSIVDNKVVLKKDGAETTLKF